MYRLGHEKVTKRILAGEFIIVALSVAVGFVIRQTIGNPVLQAFCQGYHSPNEGIKCQSGDCPQSPLAPPQ